MASPRWRILAYSLEEQLRILGWSGAELARRLAVSEATVSRWRSGRVPRSVLVYLDEAVDRKQAAERVVERLSRPKGKPRGPQAPRGRG